MSKEDLTARVHTWIKKTGLPLELETAVALANAGFDTHHSFVYEDPESKSGREIDVVGRTTDRIGLVEVHIATECKSSDKPWVVLARRPYLPRATFLALGISDPYTLESIPIQSLSQGRLGAHLKGMDSGGYALKQAFSENVDAAYAATMSALKAAAVLAQPTGPTRRLAFAFPVLVVDAPIFECTTNPNGGIELEEVMFSEFMFTAMIPERTRAIVRIVHREAVSGLATYLFELADILKQELKYKVDEFLEEVRQRNLDSN